MKWYPGLAAQPWHDAQQFAAVVDFERNASCILAEAETIDDRLYRDEPESIARTGRWTVFFLYERGRRIEQNCAICPTTAQIVDAHPSITTMAGMVYFSRLAPHSRVAPHKGPTNMRVRCHFGINIPASCGIRVGGIPAIWQQGRCMVFDDSFEHEAWNDSDDFRTVLIVDFWHPELNEDEVELLDALYRFAMGRRRSQ
jgi:aspartate beta-hydroxylase